MGRLERRLERLEEERRRSGGSAAGTSPEEKERRRRLFRPFWEAECEFTAHYLVSGSGPRLSVDEDGYFYALDGTLAAGPDYLDLRALVGGRRKRMQELRELIEARSGAREPGETASPGEPPENHWERFLAADESAAKILEELKTMAETADVPDDYRMPNHWWHDSAEIRERVGDPFGVGGSIFADAEETEATRRMTWALIHNPEAMRLLSELTSRRDVFVVEDAGQE